MDELRNFLTSMLDRFFSRELVCILDGAPACFRYSSTNWESPDAVDLTQPVFPGERVLLVPDVETLFRYREFPADHLSRADLEEAVRLDAETWSPWQGEADLYFWPQLEAGVWRVGVWVWPAGLIGNCFGDIAASATHVMPEFAWRLAAASKEQLPAIFSYRSAGTLLVAVLSASGIPTRVARLADEESETRFWRSLNDAEREWPVVECTDFSGRAAAEALHYARCEGTQDWRDPRPWARPAALVLGAYLLWVAGSGAVVWKKADSVGGMMVEAQSAAAQVVLDRERVEEVHATLEAINELRDRQSTLSRFIVLLGEHLPDDVRVESLQFNSADGARVQVSGTAENAVVLPALLEALPEITYATLRGSIRQNDLTGLTPFTLELVLDSGGSEG